VRDEFRTAHQDESRVQATDPSSKTTAAPSSTARASGRRTRMSNTGKIARRLAQGLLDAVLTQSQDATPACQRLRLASELFAQCPEARQLLENPRVPSAAKEKVFAALADTAGADDPVVRLVRVLAARQAIELVGGIEQHFVALWNARRGAVAAEVVSASALAPRVLEDLRLALERASGKTVELKTAVDPGLMGGVVVRLAGRTLDGSVRGRLWALRARLRQGATR
jgi:F-type H+-transporting ATPase subunit delta